MTNTKFYPINRNKNKISDDNQKNKIKYYWNFTGYVSILSTKKKFWQLVVNWHNTKLTLSFMSSHKQTLSDSVAKNTHTHKFKKKGIKRFRTFYLLQQKGIRNWFVWRFTCKFKIPKEHNLLFIANISLLYNTYYLMISDFTRK